uniref:Uncharacterized protein n=1 Tax=Avena sativa TaxID=4498 RepID=A0ACD5UTH3_AVESA
MYNGIGLQTARGSGTNGYVQTNKFFIRPRTGGPPKAPFPSYDDGAGAGAGGLGGMRKPNKEILEHDRKRQVELQLVLLRDTLEEQGYTEGEIEDRVEEARKEAEIEAAAAVVAEAAGGGGKAPAGRPGEGSTGTQSHHVAARKEKQLETMRAALGLDVEVGKKKKDDVDSDPESGELVPGKDSDGLDIDVQNDGKALKDGKKHSKRGKKEKGNDRKSHSRSSRKNKHGHDSEDDSDTDHEEKNEKRHGKKSFLDRVVDSAIVHKKIKHGKDTHTNSEADSDSDHGKNKIKHVKSSHDEGKKVPLKSSRHSTKDEKSRRSKYKDDSYSDSESDVSYSDSGSDYNQKRKKSSQHNSKDDKQAPKSKEKEAGFVKNADKRKRHDSDSDGYGHDRKIHTDAAVVRKDHSLDKSKSDLKSDEYNNKRSVKTSRHDSDDEKPHSKVLRKDKYTDEYKRHAKTSRYDSEDEKPHSKVLQKDKYTDESETDSEMYNSGKKKAGKSSQHVSKVDKQAPKHKLKGEDTGKNVNKRMRHDSDSDSDGWERRLDTKVKKIVEEKRRVISSSESSFYSSSSSSSESDASAESHEIRKKSVLKNSKEQNYAKRASYKNELDKRKISQDGRRKDLEDQRRKEEERMEQEKQKQREEERKELEKQKHREEGRKELEKQKHREEERKELEKQKLREMEEERPKERENERRKGEHAVERDYKRKVGEDRYDPNSNRDSDDESRDRRMREEYGRHRTRDADSHDSKRSRYDDSYKHRRSDYEDRYSRDEYRDRRHR